MNLAHLTRATVVNQAPGYVNKALIAIKRQMLVIGAVDPEAVDGLSETIEDDHTFIASPAGQGFIELYCLPKSSEAKNTSTQEEGAIHNTWEHKLFMPGDSAVLSAMIKSIKNEELVVLVEDANEPDGPMIQYGGKKISSYVSKCEFTSGNQYDGKKGWELTVTSPVRYFYTGTVTMMT